MIEYRGYLCAFLFDQVTIRTEDGLILCLEKFTGDLEELGAAASFVQAFGNKDKQRLARGETAQVDLPFLCLETKAAIAKQHAWLPANPLAHVVFGNSLQRRLGRVHEDARGKALQALVADLRMGVFRVHQSSVPFFSSPVPVCRRQDPPLFA